MCRDSITEMRPPIAIDASHLARLSALSSRTSGPMAEVSEYLREELDRAYILPAEQLRPDIVNLGSRVEFRDEQTGRVQEIILVYPLDADIDSPACVGLDAGGRRASRAFRQSDHFIPCQSRRTSRADRAQGETRDLAIGALRSRSASSCQSIVRRHPSPSNAPPNGIGPRWHGAVPTSLGKVDRPSEPCVTHGR